MTQLDVRSATAGPEVRETEAPLPREAPGAIRWLALVVVIALVSGVAIWVTSPRFEIDTPSLVDDWAAIERSPDQLSEVARLGNPEEQRFRPGWILWNYVQWHTFDGPHGLVGPNLWNIARILVFVAGLCLATALALPRPRDRWDLILYSGLAGLPALLTVVTVPKFARDLARFGIQEPLLVGGLALGGSLLVLAARSLLSPRSAMPHWQTAALGTAGSVLWIVGAYQKEASVAVLPVIAAVLFVGRDRLRAWTALTARRRALLVAVGAVVLLPLAHVAIESIRIASRGDLVYDTEVDAGRSAVDGLVTLWDWSHEVFPQRARQIVLCALVLTAVASVFRRRIDVLAVGVLASAALTLLVAGQSGVAVSRYYLPAYALALVALALALGRLPRAVQVSGVAVALLLFVQSTGGAIDEVDHWVEEEQVGAALVQAVANVEQSGCPVAVAGLDLETSEALPVLVGLEKRRSQQACGSGSTYLVARDFAEGRPLLRACARGALEPVWESWIAGVYRCTELRAEPVRDPTFGLVEPQKLVALRRFRAGS